MSTTVQASDNKYSVLGGIGLASCASYADEYKKNSDELIRFQTWANGYISALNHTKYNDVAINVDLTARSQWMYEYCKNNTLDVYEKAVYELVQELIRRQK